MKSVLIIFISLALCNHNAQAQDSTRFGTSTQRRISKQKEIVPFELNPFYKWLTKYKYPKVKCRFEVLDQVQIPWDDTGTEWTIEKGVKGFGEVFMRTGGNSMMLYVSKMLLKANVCPVRPAKLCADTIYAEAVFVFLDFNDPANVTVAESQTGYYQRPDKKQPEAPKGPGILSKNVEILSKKNAPGTPNSVGEFVVEVPYFNGRIKLIFYKEL